MVGVGWSRIVGDAKPLGRPLELQEHLVCDRWDFMSSENADALCSSQKLAIGLSIIRPTHGEREGPPT